MLPLSVLLAGFARDVPELPVTALALDSRAVTPGAVFCAVRGHSGHGLDHVQQAIGRGASAVLWEPPAAAPLLPVPAIPIERLGRQVSQLASRLYGIPSHALAVLGVTGTDGKTSCTHFLAQALSEPGRPAGLLGTLGYGLWGGPFESASHTTPDAIGVQQRLAAFVEAGVRHAAMEVSSHALDQGRVEAVHYACAILTHLSRDHLDYHGTAAAYAAAKMRLFAELDIGAAVLNLDDAFGRSLCTVARAPIHGYGLDVLDTEGLAGWVQGSEPVCDTDGLRLSVHTHLGAAELASTLLGRFNAQNLLACLAALLALGMPLDEAVGRLARSRTVPGRMERFGGGADRPLAVVDYAHTPNALQSVLTALRAHTAGRLYCVFGCGGDRDAGKRPLMGAAAERLADRVILTSDNPRSEDPLAILADIRAGCAEPARVQVEPERAAAIRQALAAARPGDVVLIAGKGHEDYQIIGSERRVYSDRAEVAALFGETSA